MVFEPASLTAQLRQATDSLHREAERSGIIRDLLSGRAHPAGLITLLHNLLPVYEALEAGLERRRGENAFQNLARPELYRAAALRHDLARLGGSPPILPEGRRYAARIGAGLESDLVAFAYVRYIGDLSGGRIISRLIGRTLSLPSLSFYEFPEIANTEQFRDAYRHAIDEAGAQLKNTDAVIAAAQEAFRLDILLSTAVALCTPSP